MHDADGGDWRRCGRCSRRWRRPTSALRTRRLERSTRRGELRRSRARRMPAEPRTIAELAARPARRRDHRGSGSPSDCLAADRRRANPSINAFITVLAERGAGAGARRPTASIAAGHDRGPLHGVPISLKDLIDVARRADDRRLTRARRSRRRRATPRSSPGCATRARSSSARPTCTSSRSARPTRTRPSVRCAIRSIPSRSPGGSLRRIGGVGARRDGLRLDRHRHRRLGPHSGGGLRPGRPEAGARRDSDRRRRAAQHDAGPRRAAVPVGRRRGAPVRRAARPADAGTRRAPRDAARAAARRAARLLPGAARRRRWPRRSSGCARGWPTPARTLEDVDDSARRRHRPGLPAHRAVGGGGATTPRRSRAAPTTTRRTCASGSRWAATSWPRTTCARCAGATCCRAKWTRRSPAATRCCCRRWPCRRRRLGAATVRVGGVDEPVRNITLRLTQLFNVTGHPAITVPCGVTPRGCRSALSWSAHAPTGDLLAVAAALEPYVGPGAPVRLGRSGMGMRRNVRRRRGVDVRRRRSTMSGSPAGRGTSGCAAVRSCTPADMAASSMSDRR